MTETYNNFFEEWQKRIDAFYDIILPNELGFDISPHIDTLKKATRYDTLWYYHLQNEHLSSSDYLSPNGLFKMGERTDQGAFYARISYLISDCLCYSVDINISFKNIITKHITKKDASIYWSRKNNPFTKYSFPIQYAFFFFLLSCCWSSRISFNIGTNYYYDFVKLSNFREKYHEYSTKDHAEYSSYYKDFDHPFITDTCYNQFLFDVFFRYPHKKCLYDLDCFFDSLEKRACMTDLTKKDSIRQKISDTFRLEITRSLLDDCKSTIASFAIFSSLPMLENDLLKQYMEDFWQINLSYDDFTLIDDVFSYTQELPASLKNEKEQFLANVSELAEIFSHWLKNNKIYFITENKSGIQVIKPKSDNDADLFNAGFIRFTDELSYKLKNIIGAFLSVIDGKISSPYSWDSVPLTNYLTHFCTDFSNKKDSSFEKYLLCTKKMKEYTPTCNLAYLKNYGNCLLPISDLRNMLYDIPTTVDYFFDNIPMKYSKLAVEENVISQSFDTKCQKISALNSKYRTAVNRMHIMYSRVTIYLKEQFGSTEKISHTAILEYLQENDYFNCLRS